MVQKVGRGMRGDSQGEIGTIRRMKGEGDIFWVDFRDEGEEGAKFEVVKFWKRREEIEPEGQR